METDLDPFDLQRFLDAQDRLFDRALSEIRSGRKESHWMWFIFPQLAGLGCSPMAQRYAIGSIEEARAYAAHPLLGHRLRQIVEALLGWAGKRDAVSIFGPVDALKLRSSLTLFAEAAPDEPVFKQALFAFYESPDSLTRQLLDRS